MALTVRPGLGTHRRRILDLLLSGKGLIPTKEGLTGAADKEPMSPSMMAWEHFGLDHYGDDGARHF